MKDKLIEVITDIEERQQEERSREGYDAYQFCLDKLYNLLQG